MARRKQRPTPGPNPAPQPPAAPAKSPAAKSPGAAPTPTSATDPLLARVMGHISDRRYQPTRMEELAEDLGVSADELESFSQSVHQLVEDGQLIIGVRDTVGLPPLGNELIGTIRVAERGFGFVVPDAPTGHGDLFVPAQHINGAMSGDHVRARVIHEPMRGKQTGKSPYIGRIVEITQRAERRYVGNLRKLGSQWIVDIDGKAFRDPVNIGDPHAKNAKAGDKVVVELIDYPGNDRPAKGVITEVLGEQGEPDVETQAVMRAFGLEERFSEAVLDDARQAARSFDDSSIPQDREDFTHELVMTIDPPDAKDYDDAIHIKRLDPSTHDGAVYELGVHIADVAHFVVQGTALDREAYKRGNSSYLPRKVIPMLPELLSNGVCSLQEGVNRFTISAVMRYDAEGAVVDARFARGVIRSAKRMTYLEAQALITGDLREAVKHAKTEPKYPKAAVSTMQLMDELAKVIRKRRLAQGMVVLGLPDVELVFDDSGRVIDAVPEDDAFTHTIIEMFMVEANEAAARLFDNLGLAMVRRIHPDPPSFDFDELRSFCRVAGYNIPDRPTRQELQHLLDAVRGKPAQHAVHLAVLQTLSKAEYSPLLIGHYALASKHYTHFTSPIRRYPDLVVHRGLACYIENRSLGNPGKIAKAMVGDARLPDEEAMRVIGKHCSTTERNSDSAEKDLRTYLVMDFLRQHLGDDFPGTVKGVTNDGIFVQLDRYLTDGFVRVNDLPGQASDQWRLNRTTGALVAQRSGKTITIGDRFIVRIAKVSPERRRMELAVVSAIGGATGGADNQKQKQDRNQDQRHEQNQNPNQAQNQNPRQKQQASSPNQGQGQPQQRRKQSPGAARSHEQTKKIKTQRRGDNAPANTGPTRRNRRKKR